MAWNEPGGGRDNDPWAGRGGDKGPPDLDEALRKLQRQLANIFSGKGGRGAGPRGRQAALLGIGVAFVLWLLAGWYVVDQAERAVVYRFGAMQQDVVLPGLHWRPLFIDTYEKLNVTQVNSHDHQSLMLSEDQNLVDVSLTVQWVINDAQKFLTRVRDPEQSLADATESALRHVIGGSTMDSIITEGREQIATNVQRRLQQYLERYGAGILVSKVNINQSGPPKQVQAAFDDVQKAKEDEVKVVNEANAYAEQVIPAARGEAQKQIEESNAYHDRVIRQAEGDAERFTKLYAEYSRNKQVTRDRLYIDAMETVLTNASKVIVDVKGGNNMLYLPLDKLIDQARANGASGSALAVPAARDATETAVPDRSAPPRETRP